MITSISSSTDILSTQSSALQKHAQKEKDFLFPAGKPLFITVSLKPSEHAAVSLIYDEISNIITMGWVILRDEFI